MEKKHCSYDKPVCLQLTVGRAQLYPELEDYFAAAGA